MTTSDNDTPDYIQPPDEELAARLDEAFPDLPSRTAEERREPPAITTTADGVMFFSGEVIVRGEDARASLAALEPASILVELRVEDDWSLHAGVSDVLRVIETLREEGHVAQPNHAFSASGGIDGTCCECGPHPSLATRLSEDGLAGLLFGQPFRSQPFRSQPFRSQPFRSQPFRSQASPPMSTARPADGAKIRQRIMGAGARPRPLVLVLDTGLANPLPAILQPNPLLGGDDPLIFGSTDIPDADTDNFLDPVAGHGTFIAGIIQQLAPGCVQWHRRLTDRFGIVQEWKVLPVLKSVAAITQFFERDVIVSMSFGGPTLQGSNLLEQAVGEASAATSGGGSTTVLVAAAGNDGTCRPYYPAAWQTVVGVGAVGAAGPPEWTNYGPWVDACAPGVDLVSSFFTWNGAIPSINTVDEDDFDGWAVWTGTSFSVPVVVAALARAIVLDQLDAVGAVDQVVRGSHLARSRDLGTVVNV